MIFFNHANFNKKNYFDKVSISFFVLCERDKKNLVTFFMLHNCENATLKEQMSSKWKQELYIFIQFLLRKQFYINEKESVQINKEIRLSHLVNLNTKIMYNYTNFQVDWKKSRSSTNLKFRLSDELVLSKLKAGQIHWRKF
jgi:hypothetical protein